MGYNNQKNHWLKSRGSTLVESALVLPILMALAVNVFPIISNFPEHRSIERSVSVASQFVWKRCGGQFIQGIDFNEANPEELSDPDDEFPLPSHCSNDTDFGQSMDSALHAVLPSGSSAEWAATMWELDSSNFKVKLRLKATSNAGAALSAFPTQDTIQPDGTVLTYFEEELSLVDFETKTGMPGVLNVNNKVIVAVESWVTNGSKNYDGITIY